MLLLLRSVGSCSSSDSLRVDSSSAGSISSLSIAASSAVLAGEKRVLRTVSLVREDPRLVLLSPSFAAAAAAAAVVSVAVVFIVGLFSLLASPVTRLDSSVVVPCVRFSDRVFGLRLVSDWASSGINQINEMRIRPILGKLKIGQGSLVIRGGL